MNTWSTREREGIAATLRRELVDAQVEVLGTYLDKRPTDVLIVALQRLVGCCRASFREEEALMARLGGQIDPTHRTRHELVLQRLEELCSNAGGVDRGQLLARLIEIDRELIAHVAETIRSGDQMGSGPV